MNNPIMQCGHKADGEDVKKNPVCTKCAGKHPGFNIKMIQREKANRDWESISIRARFRESELEPEPEPEDEDGTYY